MNEGDEQIDADSADLYQPGKIFPKDGLGLLKIHHDDEIIPEAPKMPSLPVVKPTTPTVEIKPEPIVSEVEPEVIADEIIETPEVTPESTEAIDLFAPVGQFEPSEAAEVAEPAELTLPEEEEDALPKYIGDLPAVAPATPKKSKRRAAILVAVIIALLFSSGVSAWWVLGNKDSIANQSEDKPLPPASKVEPEPTITIVDSATQDTPGEQESEVTIESTPPPSVKETTVKTAVQQTPVVIQPAEPTAPQQQFERGTMTLTATRDFVSWHYTGKAIYGYKLAYSRQTHAPSVENSPYISFSSMNETSFSIPTSMLPKGTHIVRVCAYSGETCVDYSEYAIVRNY